VFWILPELRRLVPAYFYSRVQVTIRGRDCKANDAEIADDCLVLIRQIPLESLDSVVDPVGRWLIENPDHGGEQMFDLF
jgi:hypothetical protein